MDHVSIKPLHLRPILVLLQDEEGVNFRAANLCAGPLYLRRFAIPEACHPLWNDTNRALQSSKLKSAILRGTVLTNHVRGPFRSGRHHFDMVEAALAFLRSLPEDELSTQWSEDFGFDIGDPAAILTKERFLNSPGIRTRLPAAPVHMFLSGVFFEHGLHLNFIVK